MAPPTSRERWQTGWRTSAARSRRAGVSPHSPNFPPPECACSTSCLATSSASARKRFPSAIAPACAGTGTGPASSRWTGRSTARFPGSTERCARAPTVRIGGGFAEIVASEAAVAAGRHARAAVRHPRAAVTVRPEPRAGGTADAVGYCHVPNGSRRDMTSVIEAQVERFAPGFRTGSSAAIHGHRGVGGTQPRQRQR